MSARKPGSSWLDWTGGRSRPQQEPAPESTADAWPADDEWTVDEVDDPSPEPADLAWAPPEPEPAAEAWPDEAADDDNAIAEPFVPAYAEDDEVEDAAWVPEQTEVAEVAEPLPTFGAPLLPALVAQVANLELALEQIDARVADLAGGIAESIAETGADAGPDIAALVDGIAERIAQGGPDIAALADGIAERIADREPAAAAPSDDIAALAERIDLLQSAIAALADELVAVRDEIIVVRRRVGVRTRDGLGEQQLAELAGMADTVAKRVIEQILESFELIDDKPELIEDKPEPPPAIPPPVLEPPPEPRAAALPAPPPPRRGREPLIGKQRS